MDRVTPGPCLQSGQGRILIHVLEADAQVIPAGDQRQHGCRPQRGKADGVRDIRFDGAGRPDHSDTTCVSKSGRIDANHVWHRWAS